MTTDVRGSCARCDEPLWTNFSVPDEIWNAVGCPWTPVCLVCFIKRADRYGIEWEHNLELVDPKSRATAEKEFVNAGGFEGEGLEDFGGRGG